MKSKLRAALAKQGRHSSSTIGCYLNAYSFLVNQALKRTNDAFLVPASPSMTPLPDIYTRDEVKRLIAASDNLLRRTLLMTAYSTGMRIGEVIQLGSRRSTPAHAHPVPLWQA